MNRFLDEGGGDDAIEAFVHSNGYMHAPTSTSAGVFQIVARVEDDRLRQKLLNRSADRLHRAGRSGIEKSLQALDLPRAEIDAALEAMNSPAGDATNVTVPAEVIIINETP